LGAGGKKELSGGVGEKVAGEESRGTSRRGKGVVEKKPGDTTPHANGLSFLKRTGVVRKKWTWKRRPVARLGVVGLRPGMNMICQVGVQVWWGDYGWESNHRKSTIETSKCPTCQNGKESLGETK